VSTGVLSAVVLVGSALGIAASVWVGRLDTGRTRAGRWLNLGLAVALLLLLAGWVAVFLAWINGLT
jgi:hypothetical protein